MKSSDPKSKFIFLLQLKRRAEKEESPYARLLFQENIISSLLVATLLTIELLLNRNNSTLELTNDRKIGVRQLIKVKFEQKDIETKTLGQLCFVINPFLGNNNDLKLLLKKFVTKRNDITHKMFSKYENMKDLEKDSLEIIKIGENVIKELDIFRNEIFQEWDHEK